MRWEIFIIGKCGGNPLQTLVAFTREIANPTALEEIPDTDRREAARKAASGQNGVQAEAVVGSRNGRIVTEQDFSGVLNLLERDERIGGQNFEMFGCVVVNELDRLFKA